MTDQSSDNNVAEIPCGRFVISGHAPTTEISMAKSENDLSAKIIIKTSVTANLTPFIQAKGTARIVKNVISDDIEITDRIHATIVNGDDDRRIITPPYIGLRRHIRIIAGSKYYEDVVKPTMADIHHLHYEAMMRGDDHGARKIERFGLLRILLVMLRLPLVRLIEIVRRSIAGN